MSEVISLSEVAAIVSWYGPYRDLGAASFSARNDGYQGGLYVVFGYRSLPARGRPKLLYVGLSSSLGSRLSNGHGTIDDSERVAKITSIWLGEISSHKRPGRRAAKTEPLMDTVESAMISLLGPCLNTRKRSFPNKSFAILHRWYSCDDFEKPLPPPVMIWPDLMECAGASGPAYLCWLEREMVKRFNRPPRAW